MGDLRSGANHVLVLPHATCEPSGSRESSAGVGITCLVPFDLVPPVPLVRTMGTPVLWTAMPEAPVHEHGDRLSSKHDVGSTVQIFQWARMHAVTKPKTMEGATQRKFRSRVLAWQSLHPSSNTGRRGEGLPPLLRHATTVSLPRRLALAYRPRSAWSDFGGLLGASPPFVDAPLGRSAESRGAHL